jgi:hypothetical protein
MSEQKRPPTHHITFSEKTVDERGREKLGKPIDVATIWERQGEKQGGIFQWHIDPAKLGDGVYFQLENNREQGQRTEHFERPQGRDRQNSRER